MLLLLLAFDILLFKVFLVTGGAAELALLGAFPLTEDDDLGVVARLERLVKFCSLNKGPTFFCSIFMVFKISMYMLLKLFFLNS